MAQKQKTPETLENSQNIEFVRQEAMKYKNTVAKQEKQIEDMGEKLDTLMNINDKLVFNTVGLQEQSDWAANCVIEFQSKIIEETTNADGTNINPDLTRMRGVCMEIAAKWAIELLAIKRKFKTKD